MGNKYTEIEMKFPLSNPKEMIQRLNKIAKLKLEDVFQKDTYFIPAHRNFLDKKKISEWLRIRETDGKITLNYKNWYPDGFHCDEFETIIEDVTALKKIFESLDFKEIMIVEKTRNAWIYKEVEIVIDEVKDLGFFIELEAKTNLELEKAKKLLYETLKELKAETGEQDFKGYPWRLLEKKGLLRVIE